MTVPVQGPDGNMYQFPDGTDKTAAVAYFKKKGIGAKPSAPSTPPQKPGMLEPHGKWSVGDIFRGAGAGIKQFATHPLDTLAGMVEPGLAAGMSPIGEGYPAFGPGRKQDVEANRQVQAQAQEGQREQGQFIKEHPAFAAGSVAGPALVTHGLTRILPKVAGAAFRGGTGTGPRALKSLVKETTAANEAETAKAAEKNTQAAQEHAEKTQEALHETEGRELKHQQEVKAAAEEATQKNKLNLKKHFETRESALAERQAAEEKLKGEKAKQERIEPTKTKLQTAWSNLRAGIETAREKASEIGNKKYNAVNSALNQYDSDPEVMRTLNASVIETVPGEKMPPLVKEFDNRIFGKDASGMPQGPPTYDELQSFYSKLGNALSKGTLDGETYHAYDVLHEGIGEEMQRIANDHGMSKELFEARQYWRRMKQAFGKPLGPTDAGTKTLRTAAPDLAEAQDQANRIRLIGSFDPDIPKLAGHIENIQRGVESLPKPTPERDLAAKAKVPEVPARKPILPKVEPKPVAPPERAAVPDRPAEVAPDLKKIGMEDIREAKAKGLQGRADWIRKKASSIVVTIGGYRMLSAIIKGDFASLPPDFAEMAAGVGVSQVIASVLENPTVARLLTEPTPRDLAKIPTELRGADLKTLVDAAQKQGIKVDPRILAAAGVGGAQASRPKKRVAAALTR